MKMQKWLTGLLVLVVLLSLTACGSNDKAAMSYDGAESAYDSNSAMPSDKLTTEFDSPAEVLPENRKLIRTLRMEAETEALDTLLEALDAKTTELGGYVEGREVYNGSAYSQHRYRSADITFRIPAENLRSFTEHIASVSNVVSSNETIDDITLQYVDTESRIAALEVERERLMVLMEQAQSLSDLLEIERRLTEVRYELENYESQLRGYDNKVDYATVYVEITEVKEFTPVKEETVWERISTGFVRNLKAAGNGIVDFLVWLIVSLPFLVIYAAVGTAAVLVLRRCKFRRKPRKGAPPEKTE